MATVAAGERETGKQLGTALIQNGAIITARLVAERAGEPALADAGRPGDHQAVVFGDPVSGDELHEESTVQPPTAAVVDILGRRLVAEFREAKTCRELTVVTKTPLAVEQ